MQVIILEKKSHIKLVRRIKQCTTSANQCMDTGNEDGYKHWTKKAEILRHDLAKSLGIVRTYDGSIPFVSTVHGTCTQVVVLQ